MMQCFETSSTAYAAEETQAANESANPVPPQKVKKQLDAAEEVEFDEDDIALLRTDVCSEPLTGILESEYIEMAMNRTDRLLTGQREESLIEMAMNVENNANSQPLTGVLEYKLIDMERCKSCQGNDNL